MQTDARCSTNRRRSPLAAAALVITVLVLGGCVDFEQVVTIRPDGSGTIREATVFQGPMVEMIRSMKQMQASMEESQGEGSEASSLSDEEKARAHTAELGPGVRFVSWESVSEETREGGIAVYEFDDVNALRLSTEPDMDEAESGMTEEAATDEGSDDELVSFRLERRGGKRVLIATFEEPETQTAEPTAEEAATDEMAEAMNESMGEMMKPFLAGMRMRTVVQIEGTVLETDAPIVEGSRVVLMQLDFDEILAQEGAMEKLNALGDGASMAEVREALVGVPGVALPPTNQVRIVFE